MKNKTIITVKALILLLIITITTMPAISQVSDKELAAKTLLIKDANDPTVSFNIWFNTGSVHDEVSKDGIASIVGELISDGATKKHSLDEIMNMLYPMAAGYECKVEKDMTVIRGRVHKDNLEKYTELLLEAITEPAFTQEDLNRIKKQRLDYLEKTLRYSSDEELAKAVLHNEIHTSTRYGHIPEGTVEGIKSITLKDVEAFYKKFYNRNNFVVGLAGGFNDSLPRKIVATLNSKLASEQMMVNYVMQLPIEGLEVVIVEKKNAATAMSIGYPISVLRDDPEFVPLALFNSWFGQHRNQSSHLYNVIREKRGLNYGDYSYIEAFPNGGALSMPDPNSARRQQLFEIWLRPVQHQHRLFTLRAALRELKNVVDNGMTQSDFDKTKAFLSKFCRHYTPTLSSRLGYSIDNLFYGVKDNYNYPEYLSQKINKLTLEQVNTSIKKHIQYKNLKIVFVTSDAEKLKQDLLSNAPSPITYDNEKSAEILKEDKEIANFPLSVNAERIKIIKVENVFQR